MDVCTMNTIIYRGCTILSAMWSSLRLAVITPGYCDINNRSLHNFIIVMCIQTGTLSSFVPLALWPWELDTFTYTSSVPDGDLFTVIDVCDRTLKRMWVLAWLHPNGYNYGAGNWKLAILMYGGCGGGAST